MLDFLMVSTRVAKKGLIEIYPEFFIQKSSDLMIRGSDFYAIWNENTNLWSTDENVAIKLIDAELDKFYEENKNKFESPVKVLYLRKANTGMIDIWHKYCQKQQRDSYHMLDEKLIFSNTNATKKDYASKRLPYPLEEGSTEAWDHMMSVLYSEEERHKIEWCIGAIVSGDSKKIQKFAVLYGAAGTGKSTLLNVVQLLFEGYYSVFDARALGSSSNSFALEAFKNNPLVAIQHDGDLSHIEDNTRLNSLVSHELMTVNEKFRSTYTNRFKAFLFMGTNKPVKITDAKSGLLRRLIDISPTGNKLEAHDYKATIKKINFELGAIATKCLNVYQEDPNYYDDYVPLSMMGASNDFYNFMQDSYLIFTRDGGVALKAAWEMYKEYCDEAKISYPFSQRVFKEELKNYFWEYYERFTFEDGTRVRSYYQNLRKDKFEMEGEKKKTKKKKVPLINFDSRSSLFDIQCAKCPAQYATVKETPAKPWADVTSTLEELDTTKLHYVKIPENHIVIDFDIPDENGNKCLEKNIEEASKWPSTYAELSKSGKGVHLHYIYTGGDPSKLSRLYDEHIEVKVFTGKSSLRRKLTWCNDIPIASINSGLPLKEEAPVLNKKTIKDVNKLRTMIIKCLNKEYSNIPNTKPNIDFIYKLLNDCYESGMKYDVSNLEPAVMAFAANSSHQADYCLKLVSKMKFKSDDPVDEVVEQEPGKPIAYYDIEVFPNLLVINWKVAGEGKPVVRMINPSPSAVAELVDKYRLVGFNCRRYDNHIIYARMLGYDNEQMFNLSKSIINKGIGFFGEAYNLSWLDIYDVCSKKQSLKKWEIELGMLHDELGLDWDKPVPEKLWPRVAEYCDHDVYATEAVADARVADITAREILSKLTDLKINDTTNSQTTRLIFGKNKTPQNEFCYRNLAEPVKSLTPEVKEFLEVNFPTMMNYWKEKESLLPYFPGYSYAYGESTYKGFDVGEGGFVWSKPGMYSNVTTFDVASMHPHSLLAECFFGPRYSQVFHDLVQTRIKIKHKDFEAASKLFDGKMAGYLTDPAQAKALSGALKIAINSVYGLTSAKFDNPFRDIRNKDNIVAKRGALFMIDLKAAVEAIGGEVIHIKTDSIKVVNPSKEVVDLINDMGQNYGYTFEIEHHFEKICLVNDAVYIGKCCDDDPEEPGKWTATGTQFAVPYVFKTLFSKEPIEFSDMCETKSVTSSLYLDMNEGMPDGEHQYIFVGKVGQFCPIKPGCGGGELLRVSGINEDCSNKYASATGAKGYRWLESAMVKELDRIDDIDRSYYDKLVDAAADDIAAFGDLYWFKS